MSRPRPAAPSRLEFALALSAVRLGLKLVGFGRVLRASQWLVRHNASTSGEPALLRESVHRVALVAAFFPGRALCLEQSLVLWLLLRRRGLQADLRLGVQPYPFGAHAWVEHGGQPLNEKPEFVRSFVTLPSFAP
jgi:hypothetical protein